MTKGIKGYVLRKPQPAGSNHPLTGAGDTIVVPGRTSPGGAVPTPPGDDKSRYTAKFLDPSNNPPQAGASSYEYLVMPAWNAPLISAGDLGAMEVRGLGEDHKTYQVINPYGFALTDVVINPVPDSWEAKTGVIRYNQQPPASTTPVVQGRVKPLAVWYTRNDEVTRFGYDDKAGRWSPYKGGPPDHLGTLDHDGILGLAEVDTTGGYSPPPMIAIGMPGSSQRPVVTWAYGPVDWDTYPVPPDEAVASVDRGEVKLGSALIQANLGKDVFQFRRNFRKPEPNNEGSNGYLGRLGEDELYLSPIPGPNEFPRIRVGSRSYLDNPVWDSSTGKLTLSQSAYPLGEPVYYDGVYNTPAPISAYPPVIIGPVPAGDPVRTEVSFPLGGLEKDALTLYVQETGRRIGEIHWVTKFSKSLAIPPGRAEAIWDEGTNTAQVRLSYKFSKENAGKTLCAANPGDFYLEHGITFRLQPNPLDPVGDKGQPDAWVNYQIEGEVITQGIYPGAFLTLPQTPLVDFPGFGDNTFYKIDKGFAQTLLRPDEDIVYEFGANRIRWAARVQGETHGVQTPKSSLKLKNELILPRNYEIEIDKGSGWEPVVHGQGVNVDFEGGQIAFAEEIGGILYEGLGEVISADKIRLPIPSPLFPQDPGGITRDEDRPILCVNKDQAFLILREDDVTTPGSPGVEVTIAGGLPPGLSGVIPVTIRSGSAEAVYTYAYTPVVLGKRWVYPEVVFPAITAAGGTPHVPGGYQYGGGYHFEDSQGSAIPHVEMTVLKLGNLAEQASPPGLQVPIYYQAPGSNFRILRDSKELALASSQSSIPRDGYYQDSAGYLHFNLEDEAAYPDAEIYLDPSFSADPRDIEVLAHKSYAIQLPPPQIGGQPPKPVHLVGLVREGGYEYQRESGTIYFHTSLPQGSRLRVRYHTGEGDVAGSGVEWVSFPCRETLHVTPGVTRQVSFGQGGEVDVTKPIRLLVNEQEDKDARVDAAGGTITFTPMTGLRRVQAAYYVKAAPTGHEKIARLTQIPFAPPPAFAEGKGEQEFYGDHRGTLQEGTIIVCQGADNTYAYQVTRAPIYEGGRDITRVQLQGPAQDELPAQVLVSNKPLKDTIDLTPFIQGVDRFMRGEHEIRVFGGDLRGYVRPLHVLFFGLPAQPHIVSGVDYDMGTGVTTLRLATALTQSYDPTGGGQPLIHVSPHPVYPPGEISQLRARYPAFAGVYPHTALIRFPGGAVCPPDMYKFTDDGVISFDTTHASYASPGAGDIWRLCYQARTTIGPQNNAAGGIKVYPKVRASYTHYIAATHDNGIAGQPLLASYTLYSPDAFYFRALPLQVLAGEIAGDKRGTSQQGQHGPLTTLLSTLPNHERGVKTLVWEGGHWKDRDRVGRYFLRVFNHLAENLEGYAKNLTGDVVGEGSGGFRFDIRGDYEAGGEDPITGDLLPYYPNPDGTGGKLRHDQIQGMSLEDQRPYMINDIDDKVLVSKKPYQVLPGTLPPAVEFKGTYQSAWEPGRLSRFYPEKGVAPTITPPPRKGGGSTYEFLYDYGEILGDLGRKDVSSVMSLTIRAARARIMHPVIAPAPTAGQVILYAGMLYDGDNTGEVSNAPGGDLASGRPEALIPGFKVGDIVHLGRAVPGGGSPEVYAQSMEIAQILDDGQAPSPVANRIVLRPLSDPSKAIGPVATDPATLLPTDASSQIKPQPYDTIFVQSEEYPRQGTDYAVDGGQGELVNRTLPDFLATLLGQEKINPGTYLEAGITFKNQQTEPVRPPGLDGAALDDDGLEGMPYYSPVWGAETEMLRAEAEGIATVMGDTDGGVVLPATLDLSYPALVYQPGALAGLALKPFDLVVLEGKVQGAGGWSKGSIPYHIAHVEAGQRVYLAAFDRAQGSVPYTLEIQRPAGQVDPLNPNRWVDGGAVDFTGLHAPTRTLAIGLSTYTISGIAPGYFEVSDGPITESSGPVPYTLTIAGPSGAVITPDLYSLQIPGVDFAGIPRGTLIIPPPSTNAGTYCTGEGRAGDTLRVAPTSIGAGEDGLVYQTGISPCTLIKNGLGAVLGSDLTRLWVPNAAMVEGVRPGHVLTVQGHHPLNAGYYRVQAVGAGIPPGSAAGVSYAWIQIDPPLKGAAGDVTGPNASAHAFPVPWETYNPRRFSREVDDLLDKVLRYRALLQDPGDVQDPFVRGLLINGGYRQTTFKPSFEILQDLIQAVFGEPLVQGVDGEITLPGGPGNIVFTSASTDFGALLGGDIAPGGAFIAIGENLGYLTVQGLLAANQLAVVPGRETFDGGDQPPPVGALSLPFRLYQPLSMPQLEGRTYEFILYEFFNILGIMQRLDHAARLLAHDPLDLQGGAPGGLEAQRGDPTDGALQAHLQGLWSPLPLGNTPRNAWIRPPQASGLLGVRDEIEAILRGADNVYDQRFAWVDYRVNMETGTLPGIQRFQAGLRKALEKQRRELMKKMNLEGAKNK